MWCSDFAVRYDPALMFEGTGLAAPSHLIAPFRIPNAYGLFAVMTEARYEIEFQGGNDGETWVAYPFRYKPQALDERPGIYVPIGLDSTGISGSRRWVRRRGRHG